MTTQAAGGSSEAHTRPLRRLFREVALRMDAVTPGGVTVVLVSVANIVLWLAARPSDQPTGRCRFKRLLRGAAGVRSPNRLPAVHCSSTPRERS